MTRPRKVLPPNTTKFCECGCGQLTEVVPMTSKRRGVAAGEPNRFINLHFRHVPDLTRYEVDPSGCWLWTGFVKPDGYGSVKWRKTGAPAHRAVWESTFDIDLPEDLQLDHLCRVRRCVNPDHLEVVTAAENVRRGGNAILTRDLAEQVRNATGTQREIGMRFGISQATVSAIKVGRLWDDYADERPAYYNALAVDA